MMISTEPVLPKSIKRSQLHLHTFIMAALATDIEHIFEDFNTLKGFEEIRNTDISLFKSQIIRDYLEDLIIRKADPEASIVRAFQKLFIAVNLSDEIEAGHGSADFLINTNETTNIILELRVTIHGK